jgi:predicted amidohydrolase
VPAIPRACGSGDLTNPVYDLVILGGRVIDPESKLDGVRNIGLSDGRIADITTKPIEKIPGVIATGFVVWAVAYALVRAFLSA